MLGTIWINSGLGLLAFVVTLGFAWAGNVWLVSLERAGIAFVLFFLAAFPIRWGIAKIADTTPEREAGGTVPEESMAPLEDTQEALGTEKQDESFAPLSLSNVERIHPIEDPTTVAEVVRRLSDE